MGLKLGVRHETWPIKGSFRIARGAKSEAHVVVADISDGTHSGRGECVPYARYGESVDGVLGQIESLAARIESGLTREALQACLPAGAARNALDCALIDLAAKASGSRAHEMLGLPAPTVLRTAFTLSLDTPEAMGEAAREAGANGYRLLKLKIAGGGDLMRVERVRAAAPHARIIADANEGWSQDDLYRLTPELHRLGVALIEQPLKADDDAMLLDFKSPVPLCADESCHTIGDLAHLKGRYAAINIKLDKTGGLTAAIALARAARAQGFSLMIGCMVSTSLAMAPASLLGPLADFIDLDGPLLLARDRVPGLDYQGDMMMPPASALWG